jgi:predicted nucleotidyltransferase
MTDASDLNDRPDGSRRPPSLSSRANARDLRAAARSVPQPRPPEEAPPARAGVDLIEQHLDAIRDLCREFDVVRLEVFGSAATGDFDPDRSDVDFLVEYAPETNLGPWMKRYFDLEERLAALLGRPVDLVMVGALRNPYFIRSVNKSRRVLYAA